MQPEETVRKAVESAKRQGARSAEAFAEVRRSASVKVREGEVESLEDATSKGVGLRVISGGRMGFSFTSEFSTSAVADLVGSAMAVARAASPDPRNVLPDRDAPGRKARSRNGGGDVPEMELFDPHIAALPSDWLISSSKEMERAARAEPKIAAFDSVGGGISIGETLVATSDDRVLTYRGTAAYLYAVPVAGDGTQLQTGYWLDYRRFLKELEPPEVIGKKAAARAARMLGARTVPSQRAAVVFDPMMSAEFVYGIASALNGDLAWRKSTFLGERLGDRIGPSSITIVDDGLYPRGVATAPFDGEGVPSQTTPLIHHGVVSNFLYDTLTAKKAGKKSTGNAARTYASLPSIAPRNVYLAPGWKAPDEIVREVKRGLYVTAMLGRGLNVVTGEYSRGANGLWIENGEFTHPVQAVTVAGDLVQMLGAIDDVGSDLDFRGPAGAPTVRFSELAISGA